MLQKGVVSTIESDTTARVIPDLAKDVVSRPLIIPWWINGTMGKLLPGTEVLFVIFDDMTGVILSRLDVNSYSEEGS